MSTDVIADINYFTSTTDGCSPWLVSFSVPAALRSNIEKAPVRVTIHDLRGKENTVDLDTNGLEVLKYDGSIQEEFEEGSEAQQTYYKEISDILKKRLGASKVIIYNYAFRIRGQSQDNQTFDATHREPASYPHVDTDAPGTQRIVEGLLGKEEGERAMQNRIQVINIWRPLGPNPITQKPLAICDYCSLDIDKDVHQYMSRGAGLHSTGYIISRNAQNAHKWYYLSRMRSNEMYVFKMTDSKSDVAQFGCHTAFTNENEPTPNMKETSVEIRCVLLYDE
jgi:hypothetical protein